jgi:hypothetical protein
MRAWGRVADWDGSGYGLAALALIAVMVAASSGAALAAPTAPAGAMLAHPAWRLEHSPNATVPGGQIESVSCSSSSACTAVGSAVGRSGLNHALAERWNGASWRLQRAANPAGNTVPVSSPELSGVSCPAAKFCEAVGSYQLGLTGTSLAERWNGTSWAIQRFPAPPSSTFAGLTQVSCSSVRFCEAIGFYGDGIGLRLAFAARWDGTSWRLQRAPVPAEATLVSPSGVSCASPTFCVATGRSDAGPFAIQWDGTSWHLQHAATPSVGSLSCVSASFCEAVSPGGGSAEWNGSSWTAQPVPAPAGSTFSALSGMSCVTAAFCAAVGSYTTGAGATLGFGATWNGSSWASQTPPNPAGAAFSSLAAVSCGSATACEAGGDFSTSTSQTPQVTLAEAWNGSSWSLQQAAAARAAVANALTSVSCVPVASGFCETVGSHSDSSGANSVPLAEMWNGSRWKIQKTATPAGGSMSLTGVSCVSARFCMAVGGTSGTAGGAEVWKGKSWALRRVPGGPLTSVSCTSATFCMASGNDGHVDTWNGTSWSSSTTAAGFSSLTSVSCASPSACEAIGSGPSGDQAERWNGTTWRAQATPTPAGGSSLALLAVSCARSRFCEAVGSYFGPTSQLTVAEQWSGHGWKVQPTPNPANPTNISLAGVSCTSPSSCAAVGSNSAILAFTLAEVWNGTHWSLRSTPSKIFAGQNALNGVSCGSGAGCTAVGVTDDPGGISATLVETGD